MLVAGRVQLEQLPVDDLVAYPAVVVGQRFEVGKGPAPHPWLRHSYSSRRGRRGHRARLPQYRARPAQTKRTGVRGDRYRLVETSISPDLDDDLDQCWNLANAR